MILNCGFFTPSRQCRRAELFAPESRVSSLGRGPAAPAQFEGHALIITIHLLLPAVEVSPLPFLTTVPSAMFFLLLAYSSYLHFIGPSRAQVIAPNCTYSNYTWVGTLCADARFVSITAYCRIVLVFLHIVAQYASTKPLFGGSVPGSSMQRWQSVHAPFNWRIVYGLMGVLQHSASMPRNPHSTMFYQTPTRTLARIHACATQLCTTSSAHALHVRDRRGLRALTGYCFRFYSRQQPSIRVSYTTYLSNHTPMATGGM